jgi:hypothetical protein
VDVASLPRVVHHQRPPATASETASPSSTEVKPCHDHHAETDTSGRTPTDMSGRTRIPGLQVGHDVLDDGVAAMGRLGLQHRQRGVGEHGGAP